jgi:hypothetical protein
MGSLDGDGEASFVVVSRAQAWPGDGNSTGLGSPSWRALVEMPTSPDLAGGGQKRGGAGCPAPP